MAEQSTTGSKPRVLVADDEQVIANTLAIILNQAGFEARAVYSGEKAIDALEGFRPDMLISDVIMTCWNAHAPRAMSSRSWPSPCIRPTSWRNFARKPPHPTLLGATERALALQGLFLVALFGRAGVPRARAAAG